MAIQGFFTGDVKIRDLNGVLKAVDGIVEVSTDTGTVTSVGLIVGSTGTDVNVANSPITSSGNITLNLPTASATNRGLLSSADWTTFNNKQAAGNYVTLDTSQTITASKVFSVGFSIASAGGTNQPTFFENTNNLHSGSVGSNIFGFNTDNNIYFGKGSDNGGVLSWNNSEVRYYTLPNANGTLALTSQLTSGTVTSVAASITGNSIGITGSPITSSGTLAFAFAGNATQYVRGDGALATLPTNGGGGGASVSYYLNGSINQGTIGGVTYYEMNKTPIIGAGTDFSRNSNGYIASFLTDANDPALLNIPAGNFNFETYFQASSGGGSPTFYIELYKYDGTTFTLIASNSGTPKLINDGTNIEAYFSALAVPQTTLTLTDRLAIRIYVTTAGRTITLHTENGHLCQVITTFTTGLTALNGLTAQVQYLATGTSGTDFNIASSSATHTFNLPTASATNRGALSSADWTTFNNKQNALTNPITGTGTSGQVAYFNGTTSLTSSATFAFTPTSQLLVNNSVTAASAIARGTNLTPTLTAAANNDVLVGLDINPTFTNGAFTGVSNVGLRTQSILVGTSIITGVTDAVQVKLSNATVSLQNTTATNYAGVNMYDDSNTLAGSFAIGGTAASVPSLAGNFLFGARRATGRTIIVGGVSATQLATMFSTGNFLIQNAGTHTDAGFRLDVNGTARVQGNMILNTMNLGIGTGSTTNQNMAFGFQAGSGANTGTGGNMFLGYQVGRVNTSGSYNVGLGYVTLFSNTTGIQNTAIGTDVLYFNTTGSNNTAIGTNAGTFISGGVSPATIVNNSIFIGYQAYPLASSQTNQIVIGYDVVGLGSNTTVLGNASTVTTAIYGDLLIGTTTALASTKLTVSGSETASSAIARGGLINTTLVAAANNDVLVGLDINPTFTNGAFANVANVPIRLSSVRGGFMWLGSTGTGNSGTGFQAYQFTTNDTTNIGTMIVSQRNATSTATTLLVQQLGTGLALNVTNISGVIAAFTNGVNADLGIDLTSGVSLLRTTAGAISLGATSTEGLRMFASTRNVLIQNGGTFTDAGFRLDVNGTARVQNFATIVHSKTNSQGVLEVYNNTSSNPNSNNVNILSPNMPTSSVMGIIYGGKALSSLNGFGINWNHSADGSTANSTSFNFFGVNDIIRMWGTGNVAINSATDVASAQFSVNSTTKGFLPPRMTTTQKNAISSPATGLVVYDTTLSGIALYNGTNWQNVLVPNSNNNVLIGTTTDNGQGTLQNTGSAFLGGLQVGGLTFSTSTTATTSTIFYYFNGGSGQTLTLPSTVGISSYFLIKNAGTAALTISRSGSTDTIMAPNGTSTSTTISLAVGSQAILVSNGAFVWIQIV
jgi:hypothetical protein